MWAECSSFFFMCIGAKTVWTGEVTRMQDLASEFSKNFLGRYPWTRQREGATPTRTNPQPDLWPQAPQCCRDPNLGTPQRFSRNCAPTCVDIPQSLWHTDSVSSDLYSWLPSRYPWRVLISRPAEGRRLGWPEWLVATLHSETVHTRERLTTNLTRRTVT